MDNITLATAIDCVRYYTKLFDVRLLVYDILLPILGILIILLNLVTVISSSLVIYKGEDKRCTYLFLGNVAVADLLAGFSVVFGYYYPKQYQNEMTCCIGIGMSVSSSLASVYSVGLIGIDFYLYVLHVEEYDHYNKSRARLLIFMTWILSLFIGFLPAMGIRGDTDNGSICWFIIVTPPMLVLVTVIIGIIPLLVIMVLHCFIAHKARKIIRRQNVFKDLRRESNTIETSKTTSKGNPFKLVFFTTGSYFITWGPFFVASSLFSILCNPDQTSEYCNDLRVAIASPLAILAYCNSLLNPLIYAWYNNGFRESIKKILNWKWYQSNDFVNEISALRKVGNKEKTLSSNICVEAEISEGENIPLN